jgi:mono/diheme cytochrome c family protein
MRSRNLLILLVVIWFTAVLKPLAFAQDGAAIYKAKCSACHGLEGQGKVAPALKITNLSAEQIVALLTRGEDSRKPPHKTRMSGLSDADAKAVAVFVKTLK